MKDSLFLSPGHRRLSAVIRASHNRCHRRDRWAHEGQPVLVTLSPCHLVSLSSEGVWPRLASLPAVRHLVNLGFHLGAALRTAELAEADPVQTQARILRRLVRRAAGTRFGRDHRFERIRTVADFQDSVPIRPYESLWETY